MPVPARPATKRRCARDRRRAVSAFPPRRASRDGRDSYCRDCRRAYCRRWLAKHREDFNAALCDYYAAHADALRASNRARSESRRGYQQEYQRRRRALIAAVKRKPRAAER